MFAILNFSLDLNRDFFIILINYLGKPNTNFKKDRQKYEENFFIRFKSTKKEKLIENKKRFANEFDKILNFGNYKIVENTTINDSKPLENLSKRQKFKYSNKNGNKQSNKYINNRKH